MGQLTQAELDALEKLKANQSGNESSNKAIAEALAAAAAWTKSRQADQGQAPAAEVDRGAEIAQAAERMDKEAARRKREAELDDDARRFLGVPPLGAAFYGQFDGAVGGAGQSLAETVRMKMRGSLDSYKDKIREVFADRLAGEPVLNTDPELHVKFAFKDGATFRDHGEIVRVERGGRATQEQKAKDALMLATEKGWTKRSLFFQGDDAFVKACFVEALANDVAVDVREGQEDLWEIARAEAAAKGTNPAQAQLDQSREGKLETASEAFAKANAAAKAKATAKGGSNAKGGSGGGRSRSWTPKGGGRDSK